MKLCLLILLSFSALELYSQTNSSTEPICVLLKDGKTVTRTPKDTSKSFKISNYWATPKSSFEFNSLVQKTGDTLCLVTCSKYVYSPFGLLKDKSSLKTSVLKNFIIKSCKRNAFVNYDISKDSIWDESLELYLGQNKINLYLDNDPEASTHSYISKGEVYDSQVYFIDNIRIGMSMNEFYNSFFDYFPSELRNTYRIIKFESCVTDITHVYTFDNGILISVKFYPQ